MNWVSGHTMACPRLKQHSPRLSVAPNSEKTDPGTFPLLVVSVAALLSRVKHTVSPFCGVR